MKKSALISGIIITLLLTIFWCLPKRPSQTQQSVRAESVRLTNQSTLPTSPHDLEKYINTHGDDADLVEIWRSLGIPSEPPNPGKCGCRGSDCPGDCMAEVINTKEGDYAILRVCYAGEADCWYLAFKRQPEWRYVGMTESLGNQYQPPRHRIEQFQSEQWLVITELNGRGTGFLHYQERWSALTHDGIQHVLTYPISGHSVQGSADDYEFKSDITTSDANHSFAIEIRYRVRAGDRDDYGTPWPSLHKDDVDDLVYVWNATTKRFALEESKSNLRKSASDPIYRYLVRWTKT